MEYFICSHNKNIPYIFANILTINKYNILEELKSISLYTTVVNVNKKLRPGTKGNVDFVYCSG